MKMKRLLADPRIDFAWRIAWVALRLLLVLWLGQTGTRFYYQGF